MTEMSGAAFDHERYNFLGTAFQQMGTTTASARTVKGPFFDDYFLPMLQKTSNDLTAIRSDLTPAFLFSESYQPPEVRIMARNLGAETHLKIGEVRKQRNQSLAELSEALEPTITGQTIADDVLSATPYYRQGEDSSDEQQMGCALAAFRMVFAAMAGWAPSESNLARHLQAYYTTSVVEDQVYLKMFSTPIFEQMTQKKIVSLQVFGADFTSISRRAQDIRNRFENTDVYAIANLASVNDKGVQRNDIWHKVVMLGTDAEGVICHDPSKQGSARRSFSYRDFIQRWTATSNSVRLVIAQEQSARKG